MLFLLLCVFLVLYSLLVFASGANSTIVRIGMLKPKMFLCFWFRACRLRRGVRGVWLVIYIFLLSDVVVITQVDMAVGSKSGGQSNPSIIKEPCLDAIVVQCCR